MSDSRPREPDSERGRRAAVGALRLTDLLGARLVTSSGRRLGHVLDVRARRDGDRFHVEGLVTGRSGVRARLGLRAARRAEPLHLRDVVPWSDVVRIDGRTIEVRTDPSGRDVTGAGGPA